MGRHWQYLKYVLRHKWFVYLAGRAIGASFWRLLLHDISKFKPSEWLPYAACFYKPDGSKQYVETPEFNAAWNHHQKRNPHHYQYWLLKMDSGHTIAIPMEDEYLLEMIADWAGAGRAITGKWEVKDWYDKNQKNILLNSETREIVEFYLSNIHDVLK